jgi:glucose dehydrogenase
MSLQYTGELLWEATLPFSGMQRLPTYAVNGGQYCRIAAGSRQKNTKFGSGGVCICVSGED